MKKKIWLAGGVICAATLTLCSLSSVAADSQAGSGSDPLVSKSYVDAKMDEVLSNGLTDVQLQKLASQLQSKTVIAGGTSGSSTYAPVEVGKGQIVLGGEGTEFILRTGSIVCYSTSSSGLADITAGKDLIDGAAVMKNHLLVVPRNDGRGVKATQDAWLMIRGEYHILN